MTYMRSSPKKGLPTIFVCGSAAIGFQENPFGEIFVHVVRYLELYWCGARMPYERFLFTVIVYVENHDHIYSL